MLSKRLPSENIDIPDPDLSEITDNIISEMKNYVVRAGKRAAIPEWGLPLELLLILFLPNWRRRDPRTSIIGASSDPLEVCCARSVDAFHMASLTSMADF